MPMPMFRITCTCNNCMDSSHEDWSSSGCSKNNCSQSVTNVRVAIFFIWRKHHFQGMNEKMTVKFRILNQLRQKLIWVYERAQHNWDFFLGLWLLFSQSLTKKQITINVMIPLSYLAVYSKLTLFILFYFFID